MLRITSTYVINVKSMHMSPDFRLTALTHSQSLVVCSIGDGYSQPITNWRSSEKKLLLITTNYFSKWVEAKAYASI